MSFSNPFSSSSSQNSDPSSAETKAAIVSQLQSESALNNARTLMTVSFFFSRAAYDLFSTKERKKEKSILIIFLIFLFSSIETPRKLLRKMYRQPPRFLTIIQGTNLLDKLHGEIYHALERHKPRLYLATRSTEGKSWFRWT